MASGVQSCLPVVTITRFDVPQGKTISVRDFLQGLKRPASNSDLAPTDFETAPATPAVPKASSPAKPSAENPSILHSLNLSPEKTIEEEIQLNLCSSPTAQRGKATGERVVNEGADSLEQSHVIRRYTKKKKCISPLTESLPDASPLFCTQSTAADIVPEKKPTKKRKRRRAPVNELFLVRELPLNSDSPTQTELRYTKHQRQSKLTSNSTVAPNQANIGKLGTARRDVSLPRQNSINREDFNFPPTTPKRARSPGWKLGSGFNGISLGLSATKASNLHRPKTKGAKTVHFVLPAPHSLELSAKTSPTVQAPAPSTQQSSLHSPNTTLGNVNLRDFNDLSNSKDGISPCNEAAKSSHKGTPDRVQALAVSLKHPIERVDAAAPGQACKQGARGRQNIREPSRSERNSWLKRHKRVSFDDTVEQETCQDIAQRRQPRGYGGTEQLFEAHNATWNGEARLQPYQFIGFPPEFESSHARTLLAPSSSSFRLPKPPRPLKIPDPQEMSDSEPARKNKRTAPRLLRSWQTDCAFLGHGNDSIQPDEQLPKTLELGQDPYYLIPDTSLSEGNYFSKAVERLSFPAKGARSVVQRKLQGVGKCGRQSQMKEGSLKLGVTPRLKRTLSDLPFRPPFKEPL